MADIIYISKYPPLEGGIASKTFWLTNALARSGHSIHIVTDAADVDAHLAIQDGDLSPETAGIRIHRADQAVPWHIPNDKHHSISLLDKALQATTENKPDLIVGGYLVPYGIIASLVSRLTGIPYVLMHGGSDIQKFLLNTVWPQALPQALAGADRIITDVDNQDHIRRYTGRITVLPPYVPDPSAFTRLSRHKKDKIKLALIGKANYHWNHKGWQRIADIWKQLSDEFEFMVVSQGIGLEDFKNSIPEELAGKIQWHAFVPPWKMPDLLRTIDGFFWLKDLLPFPMFSNTVLEALACGTKVLTDSPDLVEGYRRHGIDFDKHLIEVIPLSLLGKRTSNSIIEINILKQKDADYWDCSEAYGQYISSIERVFFDALSDAQQRSSSFVID
ncbi:MAG: glycosyltransferase [Syntrophales bacterium]|nr:glycosyltransferase [Syntrophales bacterium]